jgi:hypothetical protein
LEIRSGRIIKKTNVISPSACGDITFLRATKFHIALEKGPYLLNVRGLHNAHRTQISRVTYAWHMRQIRVTSANPTQMLRAPAAWGARGKGCYFWTSLYVNRKYYHIHEKNREFMTVTTKLLFRTELAWQLF